MVTFWLGERCFTATLRLKHSQERYADQLERERRARSKQKKADKHQVPRTRRTGRTDRCPLGEIPASVARVSA